ncbi:hypothetical protein Dimus_019551 [Dionaea muscipula]
MILGFDLLKAWDALIQFVDRSGHDARWIGDSTGTFSVKGAYGLHWLSDLLLAIEIHSITGKGWGLYIGGCRRFNEAGALSLNKLGCFAAMLVLNRTGIDFISCFIPLSEWHPLEQQIVSGHRSPVLSFPSY